MAVEAEVDNRDRDRAVLHAWTSTPTDRPALRQAVVQASIDRLVPILMTALSTGLALVSVALGAGEPGSEIQAPMANVIIFGLMTSTAPNMVVVPAAYFALFAKGTSERSAGAV